MFMKHLLCPNSCEPRIEVAGVEVIVKMQKSRGGSVGGGVRLGVGVRLVDGCDKELKLF